ncbi:MAG: PAS domain S-box protein, partial [Gammaproteobacteria bacterium]
MIDLSIFNKLKIKEKLVASLLLAGVIPLLVMGLIVSNMSGNALTSRSVDQLSAVKVNKKVAIEDYFKRIRDQIVTQSESTMIVKAMKEFKVNFHNLPETLTFDEQTHTMSQKNKEYYSDSFAVEYKSQTNGDVSVDQLLPSEQASTIAQYRYISNNSNPLGSKSELMDAGDGSAYSQVHAIYHPVLKNFLETFEYYDVFLVDADTGHIVYSVFKELDYGTSLKTGPYSDTNFAHVFTQATQLKKGETALIDFDNYLPSYEAPASFIASPIYDGGKLEGVLIYQMPVGRINAIMQLSEGMGESGESYLVGSDLLMRSQSRFTKENTLFEQKVDTVGANAAIKGESGSATFLDYRGVEVVSSYAPVEIEGLKWALLTEIDQSEAFAAVSRLNKINLALGTVILLLIGAFAWFFAKSLSRRVSNAESIANNIAQGHFDNEISIDSEDEIGGLLSSMDYMQTELIGSLNKEKDAALAVQQAVQTSTSVIMMVDRDLIINYVNDAAVEMFSKNKDVFVKEWPDFDPENIIGTCIDMFNRNPQQQRELFAEPANFPAQEYLYIGDFTFTLNVTALYNVENNYVGNTLQWNDVTRERLMEKDYAGQLDAISKSQAVIEFEPDGTIIKANENFCATVGYSEEEIVGKHHSLFITPEDKSSAAYKQFWEKLGSGQFDAGQYKRIGKGGSEIWLQASYNPIVDDKGDVFKVVNYASNITQAELKNADYEGQLEAISKAQAVIEFELDGTIIKANDNFCATVGYSEEEIVGKH